MASSNYSSVQKPEIMGVLNVTPDSFSDGGCYLSLESAAEYAQTLVDAGACIIDVGGQSSRPGADPITAEEELSRVLPIIDKLQAQLKSQLRAGAVRVSIDTYCPEVAAAACNAGVHTINDISGFRNPEMLKVAVEADADCVLMHMAGEPRTMQENPFYLDVVQEVGDYLLDGAARLEAAGIPADRIILDPGFGFGKTRDHNCELFLHMDALAKRVHAAGYRLLIGISRKSLIGNLFGIDDPLARDYASAELATALAFSGADIIRTHNPAEAENSFAATLSSKPPSSAYLSLGSNLGSTIANLAAALSALDGLPLTQVKELATPVMSEPAYDSDQQAFANTVCRVETRLSPLALFTYIQAIEVDMGREKTRKNGPRLIDLDLLSFDDRVIDLPSLTVPHPRMTERAFVLEPLQEIAPDFKLPDGSKLIPAKEIYGAIKAHIPLELLQTERAEKDARKRMAAKLQDRLN